MAARTMDELLKGYDERLKKLERRLVPATGGPSFSSTPPSSPTRGQFWVDDETGTLYVWYVDSDGGQWIETGVGGGSIPNRNRIINGGFRTNQRAYASGATLASGAYGHDRWKANAATTSYTFTALPQGQAVTLASGKGLSQIVEQANIPPGDYVLSWEGTATGRVYNSGAGAPAYATSPIQVTLDGAADVVVEFTASSGAQTLDKVQLEKGTSPTPFEEITIDAELQQCQRYYYRENSGDAGDGYAQGFTTSTTSFNASVFFPVKMRAKPTLESSAANTFEIRTAGTFTASALVLSGAVTELIGFVDFTIAGATAGQGGLVRSNVAGATAGYLAFTAEL